MQKTLAITSSHFASAEKQFRFPMGYVIKELLLHHGQ